MAIAHLVSQKTQEVHFQNKLTQNGQVQLESTFNFNVRFADDGKRCVARVRQIIKDKQNSDQLNLMVDLVGAFACEGGDTDDGKKAIHAQCYDQLFPYIQSVVQTLMQASGIPGFQLRKAIINTDNVQVGKAQPAPQAQPKQQFPIV